MKYALAPELVKGQEKEGVCHRWEKTGTCHYGKKCHWAKSHVKKYEVIIHGQSLNDYLNKVPMTGGKKVVKKAPKKETLLSTKTVYLKQ